MISEECAFNCLGLSQISERISLENENESVWWKMEKKGAVVCFKWIREKVLGFENWLICLSFRIS